MHEVVVDKRNKYLGFSGHGGMHGVGAQARAVNAVARIGRGASDHVARIDVLDADLHLPFHEILFYFLFEENADVVGFFIAGRVGAVVFIK